MPYYAQYANLIAWRSVMPSALMPYKVHAVLDLAPMLEPYGNESWSKDFYKDEIGNPI